MEFSISSVKYFCQNILEYHNSKLNFVCMNILIILKKKRNQIIKIKIPVLNTFLSSSRPKQQSEKRGETLQAVSQFLCTWPYSLQGKQYLILASCEIFNSSLSWSTSHFFPLLDRAVNR